LSTPVVLVEQAKLLVAFFSPRRLDDLGRLTSLSSRISAFGYQDFLGREEVQPLLVRLAHVTLEALQM
jgi:ubiquitin-protein ligase E3 C